MNPPDAKANEKSIAVKALGLFEFLKEIVQIRSAVVRDNRDFVDVLWLKDIPQDQGCHCAGWAQQSSAEDSVWIEVKKQSLPKLPTAPENCIPWVDNSALRNPVTDPPLLESILNPAWSKKELSLEVSAASPNTDEEAIEIPQYLHLGDFPDVKISWDKYLERSWRPWAKDFQRKKSIQEIYSRLFGMYQQQKSLGESYEVVLGFGLLGWCTPRSQTVSRHIVSAQIEIDFDANQGTISVRPSVEGARLAFEQDMLEPDERPVLEIYLQLQERLKEIANDVWHSELLHSVLRSWIQSLHSNGTYSDHWEAHRELGDNPYLSFSPALILRKRTTRGYVRFIEEILKQIKARGGEIPKSVRLYVDIQEEGSAINKSVYEGLDPVSVTPSTEASFPDTEIYFPNPSNAEQTEIIKKLNNRLGILVQGPPGTGKSHTIGNLICHLLATGKRVLVTSQTPRALKVLLSKVPPMLRPLCVNLLGRGLSDVQGMESSVGEINRRHNAWSKNQARESIEKLGTSLYETKKRLQELDLRLRELREAEVHKYTVADGLYQGSAQQIALQVAQNEDRLGWIQDDITHTDPQPISAFEFSRLLFLKREFLPEKVGELTQKRLPTSTLPPPDNFIEMVHIWKRCKESAEAVASELEIFNLVKNLKKLPTEIREQIITSLNNIQHAKQAALNRPLPWLPRAVEQMLGEQDQPLKELEISTHSLLEGLQEKARSADATDIRWPSNPDLVQLKAHAEDLCLHLKQGGKLGWSIFRPTVVKRALYIMQNISVDGRPCKTIESLEKLLNSIAVEIRLRKLEEAWSDKIDDPKGTRFHRAAIYFEQHEALLAVLNLENATNDLKKITAGLEDVVLPKLQDERATNLLHTALDSVRAIDDLRKIELTFDSLYKKVAAVSTVTNYHPSIIKLLEALSNHDWKLWGEGFQDLQKLEGKQREYDEYLSLQDKLKTTLPNTATELSNSLNDGVWNARIESFDAAWNWSKADAWLDEYSSQHDEYELQKNHSDQQTRLLKTMEELAAEKAWAHCFERMTERQRQHLMAWAVSIKKLGKGTGKHAEKHRRDAEANLRECQDAIPAWIMPLYRVVDMVSPEPEIFDVVIVDEASQCGSEALLLQYIAKQCIIVGDEEQIAPEAVGIERNQVNLLIEQFLKDVPIRDSFDLESSLFTHAKIRYKDKVVLREHFRCVPEIIQFSNNLCYAPHGASLIPLRQYPPERLDPIKTVHVVEGFREGSGQNVLNKPEAEKLVETICKCDKDKKYDGKTFGVISLQGHIQTKYIEKILVEALGPEVIEKRSIICGQPYDFQGDERDVMFISLVAATNERVGPFTKETDKRRFNVAASRAADQVWLFHSVTLADLNPLDFRYQLLSYYLDPGVLADRSQVVDTDYLCKAKRFENPPDPFDSWFEVDVYNQLLEKGYRVIPQFRVAKYKIDLVVEGMHGRLAVECDGDEWHGPEMYEQDMYRQRILERAKWSFWRVRGSSFYRDPTQALEPLWQRLDELQIYPSGYRAPVKPVIDRDRQPSTSDDHLSLQRSLKEPPSMAESQPDEVMEITNQNELGKFCEQQGNNKRLTPSIARAIILKILTEQPSKGKDLLPREAVRELGYTCRRDERRRLEKKVQRAISDLVRTGRLDEYSTNKRQRVKINKAHRIG